MSKYKPPQIDESGRACSTCKAYKTWDNYSKHKSSTYGHRAMCKDCSKKYQAGSTELRDNELKMHPVMKLFLIDRIHLRKSEAA